MSWLTDLAGRAEALLDKMDQAAATSLQDAGIADTSLREESTPLRPTSEAPPPPPPSARSAPAYEPTVRTPSPAAQGDGSVAQLLVGSASKSAMLMRPREGSAVVTSSPPRLSSYKSSATAPTDDSLFEFLNSPSQAKETSRSKKPKIVPTKVAKAMPRLPRPHSTPVMAQQRSGEGGEEGEGSDPSTPLSQWHVGDNVKNETVIEEVDGTTGDLPPGAAVAESISASKEEEETETTATELSQQQTDASETEQDQSTDSQLHAKITSLQQKLSNLSLENKLLKREVSSLNDELSQVSGRVKEVGNATARYESEIDALREQASRSDHMIRQLRSHEEDLQAALDARDSQIQVLRTRLAEADSDIEGLRQRTTNYQKERERSGVK